MGDEIYIKFEVPNFFIYLVGILVLLVVFSGIVIAYNSNQPPSYAGHSGGEVLVNVTIGNYITLQKAVDDFSSIAPVSSNVVYGSPNPFSKPPTSLLESFSGGLVSPLPAGFSCTSTSSPTYCYYQIGPGKNCFLMLNNPAFSISYCAYNSVSGRTIDSNNQRSYRLDSDPSICSYVCY